MDHHYFLLVEYALDRLRVYLQLGHLARRTPAILIKICLFSQWIAVLSSEDKGGLMEVIHYILFAIQILQLSSGYQKLVLKLPRAYHGSFLHIFDPPIPRSQPTMTPLILYSISLILGLECLFSQNAFSFLTH